MNRESVDEKLERLFAANEGILCSSGRTLLREFALKRPLDFSFLEPNDLVEPHSSAFDGIEEWDTFSEHCVSCGFCHA